VIVLPHFGHGAETPARWVGTRSLALQLEQVNLIFFTLIRLVKFPGSFQLYGRTA
jgi:hypothetical protein